MSEKQKQLLQDYKACFGSDHGQRVLRDLYSTYMMRTSFVEGDPYGMAFNEGARQVVLVLLKKANMDVGRYMELIKEVMDGEFDPTDG